jgi:hypothetical protein
MSKGTIVSSSVAICSSLSVLIASCRLLLARTKNDNRIIPMKAQTPAIRMYTSAFDIGDPEEYVAAFALARM